MITDTLNSNEFDAGISLPGNNGEFVQVPAPGLMGFDDNYMRQICQDPNLSDSFCFGFRPGQDPRCPPNTSCIPPAENPCDPIGTCFDNQAVPCGYTGGPACPIDCLVTDHPDCEPPPPEEPPTTCDPATQPCPPAEPTPVDCSQPVSQAGCPPPPETCPTGQTGTPPNCTPPPPP